MDAQCYKGTYHWKGRDYDVSFRCEAEGVPWVLVKVPGTREEFEPERSQFAEHVTAESFGGPEHVAWVENWGSQFQLVKFSARNETVLNPNLGGTAFEDSLKRNGNIPLSFTTEVQSISREEVEEIFESETHWTRSLSQNPNSSLDV